MITPKMQERYDVQFCDKFGKGSTDRKKWLLHDYKHFPAASRVLRGILVQVSTASTPDGVLQDFFFRFCRKELH